MVTLLNVECVRQSRWYPIHPMMIGRFSAKHVGNGDIRVGRALAILSMRQLRYP